MRYGARCGLALPIPTSRAVAGVLYVLFDDTDTIDPQYRELARALAAQAGLAVELLTAREDLARQTRVTSALLTVSERLATLTDPGEVPGTLVAAIRAATGASLAAVARWSEANQRVEFAAIEGLTPEEQAGLLALDPGPELGIVQGGLEGRSAVFVAPFDPVDIPVAFAEAMGITAIAGAPITAGDDVWGFLLVATRPGDPSIVETGAELLRGFATITATAVGRTQAIALLERSHDALESAVAERTFELTQVVEELSRANRAKTEFLSNVSHELRTPLTSILGFTDLLLHGMEGPLTDAQREDLRTIDASGGRLLGLIDNLIEVSDIEAGRVELRIEPVALTPFLQERATEIRTFAGHKQQSVELESGLGPAIIYADEGRLRTVLRNLLSNAVKFTPAHGTIRIEAAGLEDDVRIDVADTGIGISPADQAQHLRTLSSRLGAGRAGNRPRPRDRARVRPPPRRRPHGRVDTWYRKPVQRLAAGRRRIADLAPPGRLMSAAPPPLVLVVDDVPDTRRLMRRVLERAGLAVVEAGTGEAALETIERERPALVVLDLRLPGMSGFDVARWVRAHADQDIARTKLLACSASVQPEVQREALDAGADAFEGKPFEVSAFAARVQQLLDARRPG